MCEQVESVSGEVPLSPVEAGLRECTVRLKSDLEQVQQESRELQERLMVSEATVQAQAEQLKDYRELLSKCFHSSILAILNSWKTM